MIAPRPRANLVLASASPRRVEIMGRMGLHPEVLPSGVDEREFAALSPRRQAIAAARAKAESVRRRSRSAWVIGCDTVVAAEGRALGKPSGAEEAAAMLRLLSGRRHSVISAVCVAAPGGVFEGVGISQVRFAHLSPDQVRAYIASGEAYDKAGAYAIQGGASAFATVERGRLDTVVGLPSHVLLRLLRSSRFPAFANLGRLR